jgi:hypothetical protein
MSKLTITVVEDERDLWAIEEPPEPLITAVNDGGHWVVYGDEHAAHPDFEEKWWPKTLYGGGSGHYREEALQYAKRWAKAVRGVYEEI